MEQSNKPICHIAIDTIFFNMGYGGISRVWETILANLDPIPDIEITLLIRGKAIPINITKSGFHTKYRVMHINEFANPIMYQDVDYLNQLAKTHKWHYFISTYFTFCTAVQNILLIHDMIPEIFNLAQNNMWIQKDLAIRNASQFITISNTTKIDLLRYYPHITTGEYPIHIIHNSISPIKSIYAPVQTNQDEFKSILAGHGVKAKRYFLTISTNNEKYKNAELIKSFQTKYIQQLCQKLDTPVPLVIITKNIPNPAGIVSSGVLFISDVSDPLLEYLYQNAMGYISSSLYEGFGLPVFEAFQYQISVIACDIPVYKELCPGAVTYIENNIDDLWAKINTVLKGNDTIQRRIAAGSEAIGKYIVEKQVAGYRNLFMSLASAISSPPTQAFINLIFQSYQESLPERRAELEHCIRANLANPYVKYIHDFGSSETSKYLPADITNHPKYINVPTTESNNGAWLTYQYAFSYSSNTNNITRYGIYWGIVNCDIFLLGNTSGSGTNWPLIRGWLNSNYILAQSRHEFNPTNGTGQMDAHFAKLLHSNTQDAWFYSTACPIVIKDCDFHIGMLGCDNAIAHRIMASGYKVINMPVTFPICHYDIAKGKTSTNFLEKHLAETNKTKPKNTHPERHGQALVPNYDALMGAASAIDIVAMINQLGGISNWEKYKLIAEMFSARFIIYNA